jgi:hypothetical protein
MEQAAPLLLVEPLEPLLLVEPLEALLVPLELLLPELLEVLLVDEVPLVDDELLVDLVPEEVFLLLEVWPPPLLDSLVLELPPPPPEQATKVSAALTASRSLNSRNVMPLPGIGSRGIPLGRADYFRPWRHASEFSPARPHGFTGTPQDR